MTCMQAALIAWITIRLWTHFLAYNPRMEVMTMTVLGIASLVMLLLEFATRVIELFLVIRSALLTRRGKERHK